MNLPRYEELRPLLGPEEKALVVIRPDPDSLASGWALALLFKKHRSSADIAIYEPIKRIENRTMVKLLRIPVAPVKEFELGAYSRLCLVDAQPNQFPELASLAWDIVIDHHPVRPEYSYAFADIQPEIGATCSMMTQYLQAARVHVSERLATALFYGITTDTDHFLRKMTRSDALAISELFPRVNYHLLRVIEQTEIPLRQLAYFELALQRLRVRSRGAVIHLGPADSADIGVILADFLLRVSGIQFIAVSCLAAEKLIIIFRSRSLRKNAGKIAQGRFSDLGSAGGHPAAARAELPVERLPRRLELDDPGEVERFIRERLGRPGNAARGA